MTATTLPIDEGTSLARARDLLGAEWIKLRRRLIGVVFLLVMALLIWFSLELYHKQFTPVSTVTLPSSPM